MVSTLSINGKPAYNVYEFVCDTADDVENLPQYCAAGSTAFVIATGDLYMMNSEKEWVKI